MKEYFLLFLRGVAMGAADVVPGVSGGTIAFITGIYQRLISSLRSIDATFIKLLFSLQLKEAFKHIDAIFLVVLLSGVGTAVISLAKIILVALKTYPEMVWAFFFGLVAASAVIVLRRISSFSVGSIAALVLGAVLAYTVTIISPTQTTEAGWFIFLSGMIAISAMILPGISGSFILLLLGKYEYIFSAITEVRLSVIALFGAGCIVGLLAFSRLLHYILDRYHDIAVALLSGFMIGSLNKVWPWKETLSTFVNRKGETVPLLQESIFPAHYQTLGSEAFLVECIFLAIGGAALVFTIDYLAKRDYSDY